MKDNKEFIEKLGTALGHTVCICATACIIAIMLALTIKFIIWVI